MDLRALIRGASVVLPALALATLLAATVLLAGDLERDVSQLGGLAPWLAGAAVIAVAVLLLAIGWRVLELLRQRRARAPGARLASRWALSLMLVAVPPIVLVYGFALRFLHDSVDSWFNVRIERALDDALALGRDFLDAERARALRASESLASRLALAGDLEWQELLESELDAGEARQLVLFGSNGQVLAVVADDARLLLPVPPDSGSLLAIRDGAIDAVAEPLGEDLVVRIRRAAGPAVLQAIYELPARVQPLARNIEQSWFDYQRLALLRGSLKLTFTLILTAVLLLAALLAILAALAVVKRQVAPIARLSEGTQRIAAGDFEARLPPGGDDELGFLTASFNRMAVDLSDASASARASQAETERQRAYLEAVLGRLSSGVVTVDAEGVLRTANEAAGAILGSELDRVRGQPLASIAGHMPRLGPFVDAIARQQASGTREWRCEVALPTGSPDRPQLLMLRAASLPEASGQAAVSVIVFDDQTELARAQRETAWLEVAQRLAHEIKNPLTPIQLASERLAYRLDGKLDSRDAEVLAKSTRTIVAQVEALKGMVDAFADYARAPQISLAPITLDRLVGEVLDLYDDASRCRVVRRFESGLPPIRGDAGRLRQLLHNLIKNAIEASSGVPEIEVELAREGDGVAVTVADRGSGLPADFDAGWFEPYRTAKAKGTGLGLAVVRKVAEEHGGRVEATNRDGGGALFTVWLPVR
jgi:nitrogen fixation/metabolism regulation signal transduction histidine kinase